MNRRTLIGTNPDLHQGDILPPASASGMFRAAAVLLGIKHTSPPCCYVEYPLTPERYLSLQLFLYLLHPDISDTSMLPSDQWIMHVLKDYHPWV